jgi:multiple sugar transport system ATP-binding protein
VDTVNLEVADGEFMVLLGPSGCGKSTTLRMIAGLETISSGSLSIDARVVNDVSAKDRDIAMVFQSYALYPHMSVADNLAFGLRRRRIPKSEIDRRVTEAADLLGLSDLLKRKPHALSGGQRQRVALGRAMVREPKVFLFDEPLSNLDAALRVNMRNELVKLQRRLGTTMIYVTHDQVEAMTMGQRICIMNNGRVVQVGKPLDIYHDPADLFVARFLGSPPMNVLEVGIERSDHGPVAKVAGRRIALTRWNNGPFANSQAKAAVLGIRPEDLELTDVAQLNDVDATVLPATISGVEPLGAETMLVVDVPESGEMIARLNRDVSVRPGDAVGLRFDPDAVHLFDAETTRAIPPQGSTREEIP